MYYSILFIFPLCLSVTSDIQRFLQCFIDPLAKEDEDIGLDLNQPRYMQRLEEVLVTRQNLTFIF